MEFISLFIELKDNNILSIKKIIVNKINNLIVEIKVIFIDNVNISLEANDVI